ncbi:uncharacterized protein LOC134777235 [Penaeus indicus]|uniref:uncharacterized protein LOC134777235 n=1 Tax=Penaeus indicus TaxID=29960 RepID=UPI00300D95ED
MEDNSSLYSEVMESELVYENSQAYTAEMATNGSIRAMAELIQQHPPMSRFSIRDRSLSRKSRDRSISPGSPPAGAPVSPSAEVPVSPPATELTSAIPKEKSIRCPASYIDINTSGLQPNSIRGRDKTRTSPVLHIESVRMLIEISHLFVSTDESNALQSEWYIKKYIVAHMEHVARLGHLEPPLTATSESTQDFWCCAWSCLSRASCRNHDVQPLQMWIEDARAHKKEFLNTLREPLHERMSHIEKMESFVKPAFHALTKASRKLWLDRQALQEVAETLDTLQENDSTVETPAQQALSLNEEMAQLGKLWSDIEEESKDGETSLFSHNNKLFISTQHPDRTIVVHIGEESTSPVLHKESVRMLIEISHLFVSTDEYNGNRNLFVIVPVIYQQIKLHSIFFKYKHMNVSTALQSEWCIKKYIVAHMEHVARLGHLEPPLTATSESTQDLWCCAWSCLSRASCRNHDVQPLQMWIEDARAHKKEFLNTLREPLHERMSHIEKMESFVKTAFHALTKASRKLWLDRQALQEVAETLDTLQENDSTVETPAQQALSLNEEMAQLGKLWSDIEEESKDGEVSLFSHNNKLFISTQHPDRTIVVHIDEESTDCSYI